MLLIDDNTEFGGEDTPFEATSDNGAATKRMGPDDPSIVSATNVRSQKLKLIMYQQDQLANVFKPIREDLLKHMTLPEEVTSALKYHQQRWNELMEPMIQQQRTLHQQLSNAWDISLRPVFESLSRNIAPFIEMSKPSQEMLDRIHEIRDIADAFKLIMLELGWTPAFDIDVYDMRYWVEAYQTEGADVVKDRLDAFFVEFYTKDLLYEKLAFWSKKPNLNERIPILTAVIRAHVDGEYLLSIPALLPQVEGLIAKANRHQGKMNEKHLKSYYSRITADSKWDSELVHSFITNILLVRFEHDNPIGSPLSRHAILHGADVNYGTAKNSLKLIILFDYLQKRLIDVDAPDEGTATSTPV